MQAVLPRPDGKGWPVLFLICHNLIINGLNYNERACDAIGGRSMLLTGLVMLLADRLITLEGLSMLLRDRSITLKVLSMLLAGRSITLEGL